MQTHIAALCAAACAGLAVLALGVALGMLAQDAYIGAQTMTHDQFTRSW